MRLFLLALIFLLSCKERAPNNTRQTATADTIQLSALKLPSDGTYEHFMDSFLSTEGITYDTATLEGRQVWTWSDDTGSNLANPPCFAIGKERYLLKNLITVNVDEGKDYVYSIDTAMAFSLNGRKYAYMRGHPYMCNGTGCTVNFHFIYDYRYKRLHLFEMVAQPDYNTNYFGDFDSDGKLDFMVVDCQCMAAHTYCDTTETVLLTQYTLNEKGYFKPKKAYENREAIWIAQFDNGYNAPRNFRIIGDFSR